MVQNREQNHSGFPKESRPSACRGFSFSFQERKTRQENKGQMGTKIKNVKAKAECNGCDVSTSKRSRRRIEIYGENTSRVIVREDGTERPVEIEAEKEVDQKAKIKKIPAMDSKGVLLKEKKEY